MSTASYCWHCGKKLVGKNGQPKPPLLFASVETPSGVVRVHKTCAKDAGFKPITAQESQKEEQQ